MKNIFTDPARSTNGGGRYTTWSEYGGSSDSMQYSALKQITRNNVQQLDVAWFCPVPDRKGNFGFNPLIVDGVMFVFGPKTAIVALAAATGKEIFVGTNADGTVRAYDKDTGASLWARELEANPEGIPAVYEVGGRQYVAFCASYWPDVRPGNISVFAGRQEAQGYYVFALPAKTTTSDGAQ